ncbi:hypothetical protein HYC85_027610 [Camellia sinensis]|uniref:Alpha-1,4 glucan phosphorylase n=1 Tax=Camellia sinensis TaxID=4442 RepID=A0A7J7G980_CAMSI|nr:hypothetical protein HYC85_027610 [Camellia sinensis]
MATLNLPAWGYGLSLAKRAKKKLLKTGLSLAIGKLSDMTLCSLSDFLVKLKYIPLDRYKTKNTINLYLWEAKAGAKDFNLFQFNDGQYELAAQLHSRAQQVVIWKCAFANLCCSISWGCHRKWKAFAVEATIFPVQCITSGWLPFQFCICLGPPSFFSTKFVTVQLNDTHPTPAILELIRLLMDDNGLGWDEAWDVTTRTIAYTNHNVLPEALEKCLQAVMWKLLPHHMEIIEEIDKRFIAMICSIKPKLENKLSSMRVMDNNPQKPVVQMSNLCVVSSHTTMSLYVLRSSRIKPMVLLLADGFDFVALNSATSSPNG